MKERNIPHIFKTKMLIILALNGLSVTCKFGSRTLSYMIA